MRKESTRNIFNVIANYIAREAFNGIISGKGRHFTGFWMFHVPIPVKYSFSIGIFEHPIEIKVKIDPYRFDNLESYIDTGGRYNHYTHQMEIQVFLSEFPLKEKKYNELYERIYRTARHETEHAAQTLRKKDTDIAQIPSFFGNLSYNLQNIKKYLTHPMEMESYCVSIYYYAKKNRKQVSQIMGDVLKKIKNLVIGGNSIEHMSVEEKEEIDSVFGMVFIKWMAYIKNRFPKYEDVETTGGWYKKVKDITPSTYETQ